MTIAAGQKPVKLDCSRLKPTKAVNSHHQGETSWIKATLIRIITPAKAITARSRLMEISC